MKKSPPSTPAKVPDVAQGQVVGGVHVGKSGIVRDIKTGKPGFVAIGVVEAEGERFKTRPRMLSSSDGRRTALLN